MRMGALQKKLEKAGYEYDMHRLLNLRTLMDGRFPILNSEV